VTAASGQGGKHCWLLALRQIDDTHESITIYIDIKNQKQFKTLIKSKQSPFPSFPNVLLAFSSIALLMKGRAHKKYFDLDLDLDLDDVSLFPSRFSVTLRAGFSAACVA
jgi:hypothetical protein